MLPYFQINHFINHWLPLAICRRDEIDSITFRLVKLYRQRFFNYYLINIIKLIIISEFKLIFRIYFNRRARPTLDYSSDTEATLPPPRSSYYYRPSINSIPRGGSAVMSGSDLAKFNSLPRERPGVTRLGLRSRLTERLGDESDGNISAPELPAQIRDVRNRMMAPNTSIFTSDEYRAWLRRAPSSSAIYEQMRTSRDILNQQRAHRFSCSAENIHDALKNVSWHLYIFKYSYIDGMHSITTMVRKLLNVMFKSFTIAIASFENAPQMCGFCCCIYAL